MDDLNRSRIRQTQQQAKQPTQPLVYRIGDRDPATGKYEMLYPDGSKATGAEKLYSAASQPGDRVLAQQRTDGTWLLSEAGASRRRRKASPSAMPPRVRKRSQVWVLYEFEGGLWVGGHQAAPVRIGDRPIGYFEGWVWGDSLGWEVSLKRGNQAQPDIVSISSSGSIVTLAAPNGNFFPIGAGFWDVHERNRVTTGDLNSGNFTFAWQEGQWSADTGYLTSPLSIAMTEPALGVTGAAANNWAGKAFVGSPDLGVSGGSTRTLALNAGVPEDRRSGGWTADRVWRRDRYSAIAISYAGSPPAIWRPTIEPQPLIFQGNYKITKITDKKTILATATAILPADNLAFYGVRTQDARFLNLIQALMIPLPLERSTDPTPISELDNVWYANAGGTDPGRLWYTNGKMTSVNGISQVERLKNGAAAIDVAEVQADGTKSITQVFAFAIPPTAVIKSFCGGLI